MKGLNMSWFYLIVFLSFISSNIEASHYQKNNPYAVVVGTVYCDACFQGDFSKSSHFISGASVAVECKDETSEPSFRREVKTDVHGEFKVHLPFSVSKHDKKIDRCSAKLISSSEPYCAVASTATSSSLHLTERKQGIDVFSAGFFTFRPRKQPNLCNQKPSPENSNELNSKKTSVPPFNNPAIFPPPVQDPTTPDLPSIPPMPGNVPERKHEEPSTTVTKLSEQKAAHPEFFLPLPPNPFLPDPTPFPPNPLQSSPFLPPNPVQPPPLIPGIMPPPSPPVPGLTPPSPPSFPFLVPPPRFPGILPASSSPMKLSP